MIKWLLLGMLLTGCYMERPANEGDVRWIREVPTDLRWIKTGECREFSRFAGAQDPERNGTQISGFECQEIYRQFYPNK